MTYLKNVKMNDNKLVYKSFAGYPVTSSITVSEKFDLSTVDMNRLIWAGRKGLDAKESLRHFRQVTHESGKYMYYELSRYGFETVTLGRNAAIRNEFLDAFADAVAVKKTPVLNEDIKQVDASSTPSLDFLDSTDVPSVPVVSPVPDGVDPSSNGHVIHNTLVQATTALVERPVNDNENLAELIPLIYEKNRYVISARELHKFLEVRKRFSVWINNQFEKGFVENVDFTTCTFGYGFGNQEHTDYNLSLDCAKEIAMMSNTQKGRQARLYFIEVERRYRKMLLSPPEPDSYMIFDPVKRAKKWITEFQERQELKAVIEEQKPKIEYHDTVLQDEKLIPVTVIAKELSMTAQQLNEFLFKHNVQYKSGSVWVPYKEYQNMDYMRTRTDKNGNAVYIHNCWTQAGRKFIHKLVKDAGKKESPKKANAI
jgi:anti-repressor protein